MEYKTLIERLKAIKDNGGTLPSVNRLLEYDLEDGDLIAAILDTDPSAFNMDFNETPWIKIYKISDRLLQTLLQVVISTPQAYVYLRNDGCIMFTKPVWVNVSLGQDVLEKPFLSYGNLDADILELQEIPFAAVKEIFKYFSRETRHAVKSFYFYSAMLEAAEEDVFTFCELCGNMRRADGTLTEGQREVLSKRLLKNNQCMKKKHTYQTAMGALFHIKIN